MAFREGLKLAMKFVTARVWKNYILELATPGLANATTVADVDDFVRSVAVSAYHFSGTAAMTASDASYGVVNPDLRVRGVKGLRIIDTSVFPFVPSGHTQAPTYIIAERAADIIKSAWN